MRLDRTSVQTLAKFARPVGWILAVLGLLFLGYALSRTDLSTMVSLVTVWQLAAGIAVYAVATLLLGLAWIRLLRAHSDEEIATAPLLIVFARSVLAKYVPGNVFQFVTRHADLVGRGIGQAGVAKSNLCEIASQVSAAAAVVCCGLAPIAAFRVSAVPTPLIWLVPAALIGGLAGIAMFAGGRRQIAKILHASFAWHLAYFLLLEAISLFLLDQAAPGDFPVLPFGAFTLAWLAGYVVIGAPGGLGVREAAFIALLQSQADIGTLAAVALTMRAITVSGDGVFSLAAAGYGARERRRTRRRETTSRHDVAS